jgi:DNA-binding MarR family transcriptional regulator
MQTKDSRAGEDQIERVERELMLLIRLVHETRQRTVPQTELRLEQPAYALLGWLHDHGDTRSRDLASYFHLDASTVSRQVDAVEREGLIVREPDPDDGRARYLRLTPQGERVLAADRANRRHVVRTLLRSWPPDDRARFASLLAQLNEGIQSRPADSVPARRDSSHSAPADTAGHTPVRILEKEHTPS